MNLISIIFAMSLFLFLPIFIASYSVDPNNVIAFAGLKRLINNGDPQFIIITSESNQHLRSIHSRTPLVIDKKNYYKWTGSNYEEALTLLKPINGNDFDFHPVSPALGKVNNDNSSLVEKYDCKENSDLPLFNNI